RPEYVNYIFLFKKMEILKKKGMPMATQVELLKKELEIRDDQASALDQIGVLSLAEAQEIDARASEIIKAARKKNANSKTLQPIPPELLQLQGQRDAIFIRAQASVERLLGSEFASFNDRVKKKYNSSSQIQPKSSTSQ